MESSPTMFAIGLMSGTSADGVDAALVRTDGEAEFDFVDALTQPYEDGFRRSLLNIARQDVPLEQVLIVEQQITDIHARACQRLLDRNSSLKELVQIVGFHGHTIRHRPEQKLTQQVGDASRLAQSLSIPVVSDFRRRDLAAGGQGAPLASLFHQQLFAHQEKPTMVLNLGGVANITWIGHGDEIRAGDTGPGCGLLDAWIMQHTGRSFDCDGKLASQGNVDRQIVEAAMQHPFFREPIPKAADRFDFDSIRFDDLTVADGAATLCAITVAGIASVVDQLPSAPRTVWVTGGGARNPVLMNQLRQRFGFVRPVEQAGLRSDSLEAECFAWLAVRRLRNLPTALPKTTGCRHPTCGGQITT